ncbi:MAG: dihydropteroate synthase [Bacteroidetes bacterium]|nr:dihydropteroate synthase [Bacteroidota bacterium]
MFTLNCKGKLLSLEKPVVMGIINVTPDSFYKGNIHDNILALAEKMITDGADILDIGGQSTRPGSTRLTAAEELERVLPVINLLQKHFPGTILSIDTYHSLVAKAALENGVSIVNDISAGELDANMIPTVARAGVPYICMHMKGTPETMQEQAVYDDVVKDILDFFIARLKQCTDAGIKDVIIDPGFGFGKTIEQNFRLLKHLAVFKMLDKPLLAGLSRKATIYKTLGVSAADALNGTTVLNSVALLNGASILRVHDVKEAKEAVKLITHYQNA